GDLSGLCVDKLRDPTRQLLHQRIEHVAEDGAAAGGQCVENVNYCLPHGARQWGYPGMVEIGDAALGDLKVATDGADIRSRRVDSRGAHGYHLLLLGLL